LQWLRGATAVAAVMRKNWSFRVSSFSHYG